MLTKAQIISLLREHYPYLAAEYGIHHIGLFGSHARGSAHEQSDVDLLVDFEHPIGFKFMDLTEYLERLLGCEVDVLTRPGLEGIRAKGVSESIARSIVYV